MAQVSRGQALSPAQSNATNFRGVISMSLSNNQMFEKTGRGVYTLRPGAILDADESDTDAGEDEGDETQPALTGGASSSGI